MCIFRATDKKWSYEMFHTCCDNRGPTLIVVRANNRIFGGYTSCSWDQYNTWMTDTKSFLFSIDNNEKYPIK